MTSILSVFYLSPLSEILYITYLTLFLTKNLYFRTQHSSFRPFFSQFVLCLTSNNSTSQNIWGGRMHGPSPTSNFEGLSHPVPPKSPPMSETTEFWGVYSITAYTCMCERFA